MEQNREECEQQGIQNPLLWFQAQFVFLFATPLSVCCLSSGTFDYIIVCNCGQTISKYIEINAVAKENNPVSFQPLRARAPQSRLLK